MAAERGEQAAVEAAARLVDALADVPVAAVGRASALVAGSLVAGGTVLAVGNGGSAAQAQHLAAELTVRYHRDRVALRAVALSADTVALTASGNDHGYDRTFARQVEALGRPGDVLVAISTSGTSPNVIAAAEAARARQMAVVALTARGGGDLAALADVWLPAATDETARAQEVHLLLLHALVVAVEDEVAP